MQFWNYYTNNYSVRFKFVLQENIDKNHISITHYLDSIQIYDRNYFNSLEKSTYLSRNECVNYDTSFNILLQIINMKFFVCANYTCVRVDNLW